MDIDLLKQDILNKIREIAARSDGRAPGIDKFETETGIKPHQWRGKVWRNWSDALSDAGLPPNERRTAIDDEELLDVVCRISKDLERFPSTGDIMFDAKKYPNAPSAKTILARWKMPELAAELAAYAERIGEPKVVAYARSYNPVQRQQATEGAEASAVGFVYLQRHGQDYKIGFTKSLNKRGRQIQIELPQEIELVHSILTDDPVGVEGYWHRRFAQKRTRGEWFKLSKADVAAFKRWSKIW